MNKHNVYDYDAILNVMAQRIRSAFDTCPHSFPEISVASGYSLAHLTKFREGHINSIPMRGLWDLAKALGVNPYWLVGAPHNMKNDYVEDMSKKRVAFIDEIIAKVSELFKVHRRDILGRAKFDFILPARFALCKILHDRGMSYASIGRVMDRDHTTVIHAVRRAEYTMQRDPEYAAKINEVIAMNVSPVKLPEYLDV